MGLFSSDYELCSKTCKFLQKMMIFGSVESKVSIIDQLVYVAKELMIE